MKKALVILSTRVPIIFFILAIGAFLAFARIQYTGFPENFTGSSIENFWQTRMVSGICALLAFILGVSSVVAVIIGLIINAFEQGKQKTMALLFNGFVVLVLFSLVYFILFGL